ncbi:cell wall-binding repeat-containing protein [Agromyces sp. M3QZ16-3]|uniref:cell wall-binding repeat-containing protein n=1 Tax=Agromyces sp. M3QZ16-3 TaxID=3447585 RepID=UPI003F693F95
MKTRWLVGAAALAVVLGGFAVPPAVADPVPDPEPPATAPREPLGEPDDPPLDTSPPENPSDVLESTDAPTTRDRSLEAGFQAAPVENRIVGTVLAAGGTSVVSASALATTGSVTDRTPDRGAGADRYLTAVALSEGHFPSGTTDVWLASGENFPDGVAVSPIAGNRGGPVLLTRGTFLPDAVAAELVRLAPANVWIAGGTGVITDGVAAAVAAAVPSASVRRLAGPDRFATAAALSGNFFASAPAAFVMSGLDFPDALAAGPAAAMVGAPSLLVTASAVPAATEAELSRLRPDVVYVIGGTGVVGDTVVSRIRSITGGEVVRVAGPDRYATAAAVADRFFEPTTPSVVLASGRAFPDALSAGPVAGAAGSPLLLVDAGAAPPRATLDAARRVSWWLPDEGRVLRYVVVAHPDDDFSAWSVIGRPDPRRYDVIIVLTTGEGTSYCTGGPVANPWTSEQYLPQPQPTGLPNSERCSKHRMDSWRAFMDGTELGPVGPWERLTSGPVEFEGRQVPVPQRRSETDEIQPADYFDLAVGEDRAFISFDMGALVPDEVLWAIQTTRALADRFPTQVEGDIIGAGFYNDTDQGYRNEHPDHGAVQETLGTIDLGLPGSQYAPVGHSQAGRAFGATVAEYCSLMCHPWPKTPPPYRGAMGHFQWSYGWLADGYWMPGAVDAPAGFSEYQSFAKWY